MHHIILNIAFNNCFLFYVFKLSGPDKLSEMFNVIIVTMIVAKLDVFRFGRFAAQGLRGFQLCRFPNMVYKFFNEGTKTFGEEI